MPLDQTIQKIILPSDQILVPGTSVDVTAPPGVGQPQFLVDAGQEDQEVNKNTETC